MQSSTPQFLFRRLSLCHADICDKDFEAIISALEKHGEGITELIFNHNNISDLVCVSHCIQVKDMLSPCREFVNILFPIWPREGQSFTRWSYSGIKLVRICFGVPSLFLLIPFRE